MDCANRAAISPGNDTRVNMIWLMRSLNAGISDPAPRTDADDRQFGRTFMSWAGLKDALWPTPAAPEPDFSAAPACLPPVEAVAAFDAALAADSGLSATERSGLKQLRAQLNCGDVQWTQFTPGSKAGRDYLAYLKAADAFYQDDWATARQGFAALTKAKTGWVAETARYMPIRIALRASIAKAFDEYGNFDGTQKVDQATVAEARDAIAAYLKAYPKGRYTLSAQGLTRRVAWLSGDMAGLARRYETMLAGTAGDKSTAADLAEEIDIKLLERDDAGPLLGKLGDTPLLLAIADLKRMRDNYGENGTVTVGLSAAELASHKPQFSRQGELFGLLEATRAYYAGDNPKGILAMLPDAAKATRYTPLGFSRQMLRGMALAKARDPNEAGFWRDLLKGASPFYQRPLVELGLALHWQRSGQLAQIFAAGSPITDSATREILLQTMATPAILRASAVDAGRPAHERDVARFTLLYKDLTRGAFGDVANDLSLIPANASAEGGLWDFARQDEVPTGLFRSGKWSDGFPCPTIAQTAATLAKVPGDRKARLCLGDFYRLNGFDDFGLYQPNVRDDTLAGVTVLGNGPDGFAGKPTPRDAFYKAIIADQRAPADERAYALYRAVMCYAPSGYNGCAGPFLTVREMDAAQAPKDDRKAWFTELKKRYPDSRWAKALRYYW